MGMKTTTKITRTVEFELNCATLWSGIQDIVRKDDGETIVSVKLCVPSGGDYSGVALPPDAFWVVVTLESSITMRES